MWVVGGGWWVLYFGRRYQDAVVAKDDTDRMKLLQSLKDDPRLPKEFEVNVQAAITIFNPAIPNSQKIDYLVAQEWRRSLAED